MYSNKITHRVIYGETDKMGIAYHANYLRWFETGRTEMFRALGLTYKTIESKGIFLPVSEAHCKFMFPAKYDDVLVVETTIDTRVKAGMKFDYCIHSEDSQRIHAKGYTKHAFLDQAGHVVRPPAFLLEMVKKYKHLM